MKGWETTTMALVRGAYRAVVDSKAETLMLAALGAVPSMLMEATVNSIQPEGQLPGGTLVIPDAHPLLLIGLFLAAAAASTVLYGAQMLLFGLRERGEPLRFADCLRTAGAKAVPLFVFYLAFVVAFAFGFVMCLVPGFLVAFRWIFAAPAIALRHESPIRAIQSSWRLTGNRVWAHVASAEVLLLVAGAIVSFLVNRPLVLVRMALPGGVLLASYAENVVQGVFGMPALAVAAVAYARVLSRERLEVGTAASPPPAPGLAPTA
jgi:hypothetical protein